MTSWVRDMVDTLPFERLPFERRRRTTSSDLSGGGMVVLGLALGAGLMYLFDPELGARRRANLRATVRDWGRRTGTFLEDASRDVVGGARTLGVVRRARPPESQSP
jgi:hypothetical protein